ncbi:MAG: SIS domain-containing protein [Thermoplasmata archaeon]|nr:SIS domain-containing protein [Thermoplasmata archaeon]
MSDLKIPSDLISYCEKALSDVDISLEEQLIDSILASRRVFIYGSGRSGLIGQLFAVRLIQLGIDVHFVGEMTTPIITQDDLTLLISNTGRTSSVVQTAEIARRVVGSKVISITGKKDCDLARTSDVTIAFNIVENEETKRIAPLGTIFEDTAHLFFECVVRDIMKKQNISEEEMRSRHAIWV